VRRAPTHVTEPVDAPRGRARQADDRAWTLDAAAQELYAERTRVLSPHVFLAAGVGVAVPDQGLQAAC
jgi:hypothetical protein